MKKTLFLALAALCIAVAGCSKDDDGNKQIELPNQSEQTQQAYADDPTTGRGFTFTAKSAWTATVTENTRASSVSWLRLLHDQAETYNGNAGTFTLNIELDANYTGQTRSATISIICGSDKITINVTQDGKTESGETPIEPGPDPNGMRYISRIVETNSSEVYITTFDYDSSNRITKIKTGYEDIMTFTYSDNKVSYISTEDYGRGTSTCTGELTLNSSGYVTSGEFLCSQDPGQWTTTYADGLLTRISGEYGDASERTSYTKSITWSGGNMTFYENTTSKSTEKATISYSTIPNNPLVNLDLNWLIVQAVNTEALAFMIEGCGDFQTIYPFAMGYYGKRSQYMMSRVNSEFWGTQTLNYSYETDSDGFITQVNADNSSFLISYK